MIEIFVLQQNSDQIKIDFVEQFDLLKQEQFILWRQTKNNNSFLNVTSILDLFSIHYDILIKFELVIKANWNKFFLNFIQLKVIQLSCLNLKTLNFQYSVLLCPYQFGCIILSGLNIFCSIPSFFAVESYQDLSEPYHTLLEELNRSLNP